MEKTLNAETNENRIKQMLVDGCKLTSINVLKIVGTTEIRHYIARLRKTMKISDKWVSNDKKRWKVYWLEK